MGSFWVGASLNYKLLPRGLLGLSLVVLWPLLMEPSKPELWKIVPPDALRALYKKEVAPG